MGTIESSEHVLVLGAGFTRAFYPNAPLACDDYGVDSLKGAVEHLPVARRLLESELEYTGDGRVDLERLLTRLDSGMPYDHPERARPELQLLLTRIKHSLISRIQAALKSPCNDPLLGQLAMHCILNRVNCLTFNYDDSFDRALYKATRGSSMQHMMTNVPMGWGPTYGYGFNCNYCTNALFHSNDDYSHSMHILKLHGSLNWFPRLGAQSPYAVSDILHRSDWFETVPQALSSHLRTLGNTHGGSIPPELCEDLPFIVPPVMAKSALTSEPILRLLWRHAYEVLRTAKRVTFIGYSLPVTDLLSNFLFREALREGAPHTIEVVDCTMQKEREIEQQARYKRMLKDVGAIKFSYAGAIAWIEGLF